MPVVCPATLETKSAGVIALPTHAPGDVSAGVGIDHHINCPNKRKYDGRFAPHPAASNSDVAAKIRAAEACAERWNVRCTGAPGLVPGETCGGFAVIAFLVAGRLVAAPCAAHADGVQRALRIDRRSDTRPHALHEFLVDRGDVVAGAFAKKCAGIREWNRDTGFVVPKRPANARTRGTT